MTNFNIGSQKAQQIANVGGNAVVAGPGSTVGTDAITALAELRAEVRRAELPDADRREVERAIDEVGADAEAGRPEEAAGGLERVVRILQRGGQVVTDGSALAGPIVRIAQALGPAARSVLEVLGI